MKTCSFLIQTCSNNIFFKMSESEAEKVPISEALKLEEIPTLKGSMCTAEDLLQASNADELEKIIDLDTANNILTIMLDYESKLNHIFLSKKGQNIMKERRNSQIDDRINKEKNVKTYQLPTLPPKSTIPISFSMDVNLPEFIPIDLSTKPGSISNFRLLHPLENKNEFNSAITEVIFLARDLQRALNIKHKYIIIPMTDQPLIQVDTIKHSLIFSNQTSQQVELQRYHEVLGYFVTFFTDICTKASEIMKTPLPQKSNNLTIDKLIAVPSYSEIKNEWNDAASSFLSLAKFCTICLQKLVNI